MSTILHGVRSPGEMTAAGALAWLGEAPSLRDVIGYLLAPRSADWFRRDAASGEPHGPDGRLDLGAVFEIAATDGIRQLRWIHTRSGTGTAVVLAEDPAALPAGEPLSASPPRIRLGGPVHRLLAGSVSQAGDGWARLTSARYAASDVPVTAVPGQRIWAEVAEYAVRDEHGNVSVADTLLTGLTAVPAGERPGSGTGGAVA